MLFSGKIPFHVAARLTPRFWVPHLLRFATICHYSPLFATVRPYSHCSRQFALFVLFAIRDYSLFAIRDYSPFAIRTFRYSRLFALFGTIRYSRLFAIRFSGLFAVRYSRIFALFGTIRYSRLFAIRVFQTPRGKI